MLFLELWLKCKKGLFTLCPVQYCWQPDVEGCWTKLHEFCNDLLGEPATPCDIQQNGRTFHWCSHVHILTCMGDFCPKLITSPSTDSNEVNCTWKETPSPIVHTKSSMDHILGLSYSPLNMTAPPPPTHTHREKLSPFCRAIRSSRLGVMLGGPSYQDCVQWYVSTQERNSKYSFAIIFNRMPITGPDIYFTHYTQSTEAKKY